MRTDDLGSLIDHLVSNSSSAFVANSPAFKDGNDNNFHISDHFIIRPSEQCSLNNEQKANGPLLDFYLKHAIDPLTIPGRYYRWCSGPLEYEIASAGELNFSTNHRANKILNGVSVAEGPWLYCKPHSHVYFLQGNTTERGPDGEPLLDRKTATVASSLLSKRDLLTAFKIRNEPAILSLSREYSISATRIFTFLLGNL